MDQAIGSRGPVSVAVIGASGYIGGELLRLLARHPGTSLVAVTSQQWAGRPVADVFPSLRGIVSLSFEPPDLPRIATQAELVITALPHTTSLEPVAELVALGRRVVDLSADYRLKDPAVYATWYRTTHPHPTLLEEAVYGLPELHRGTLTTSRLVAGPGCYATGVLLAAGPLARAGVLDHTRPIVVDAKSGHSGAGRTPTLSAHLPEAHEGIEAYNIAEHRHVPEMEQELQSLGFGSSVLFTPHLVPMSRGILCTLYLSLARDFTTAEVTRLAREYYADRPFIRVLEGERSPNPMHVRGSNYCDLGYTVVGRERTVVAIAALDNLMKGGAGQAIQCMNLMLGLSETLGLDAPALFP